MNTLALLSLSTTVALLVAYVAMHISTTGDDDRDNNPSTRHAALIDATWPMADGWSLSIGNEDLGFSTSRCDACGTRLHGDRNEAHAMRPANPVPVADPEPFHPEYVFRTVVARDLRKGDRFVIRTSDYSGPPITEVTLDASDTIVVRTVNGGQRRFGRNDRVEVLRPLDDHLITGDAWN